MSRFSKTGITNELLCFESRPESRKHEPSRWASHETRYALNQDAGFSRLRHQAAAIGSLNNG